MKTFMIAVGLVIVMGIVVSSSYGNTAEVINEQTATSTEPVVEVEQLPEEWILEAEEARQAVIDRKRAEQELESVQGQIEALRVRETELEKELGSYWTVKAHLKAEIRKTFPNDPVTAVAVAGGESGYNPRAYNPEWHYKNGKKVCQGSYGLMQIGCVHHMENPEALYDVEFNLQVAKRVHSKRGWLPWGAYTDGRYEQYLQLAMR